MCPLGSGAMGGGMAGVVSGCPICPIGTYGISPGICAPCAAAIFPATTSCPPVAPVVSGGLCNAYFTDGLGGSPRSSPLNNVSSLGAEGCFNTASVNATQAAYHYFFTLSANASSFHHYNATAAAVGLSVTAGGTLFLGTYAGLWRAAAADAIPGTAPQVMALLWGASSSTAFQIIAAMEDESAVFHAAAGDTCVRRFNAAAPSRDEVFAGDCAAAGETDGTTELLGRFGPIYDLALMQNDGGGQVLFVSTLDSAAGGGGCATIRTVSLYNGQISTFASSDELRQPTLPLPECVYGAPFRLAIPRGTFDIYYASGHRVWHVEMMRPEEAAPYIALPVGDKIIEQVCASDGDGGGNSVRVIATGSQLRVMTTKNYEPQTTIIDLALLPQEEEEGRRHHIRTLAVVCSGQRVWLAAAAASAGNSSTTTVIVMMQVALAASSVSKCLAGFVYAQNVCVPVGVGMYGTLWGVSQCKDDTYGVQGAGSWPPAACRDCPVGHASGPAYKLACEPCALFASGGQCVTECPLGTFADKPAGASAATCRPCPDGYTAHRGATASADCTICPADTFSDAVLTSGACAPCDDGYTSEPGSFQCVRACPQGTCSTNGHTCTPLTEDWEVITSVAIAGGGVIYAAAVAPGGDVFYTDGDGLLHFFDDCPAHTTLADAVECVRTGTDLLPPKCGDGCRRGFMALAVTPDFADAPQRGIRLVYAISVATHNVYRFPVLYTPQFGEGGVGGGGGLDVAMTSNLLLHGNAAAAPLAQLAALRYYSAASADTQVSGVEGWRLLGGSRAGFVDGPFGAALFNTPADIELSADGARLIVSDFLNNRIRSISITNRTVETILGTGAAAWSLGDTHCSSSSGANGGGGGACATAKNPLGIGLSATDAQQLLVVMNTENMLGALTRDTFASYCSLIFTRAQNTGPESCSILSTASRSCMLNRPYDVLSTAAGGIYVAVSNGITRIDAATLACNQFAGLWWNFTASSRGWRDGKISSVTNLPDSLFNQVCRPPPPLHRPPKKRLICFYGSSYRAHSPSSWRTTPCAASSTSPTSTTGRCAASSSTGSAAAPRVRSCSRRLGPATIRRACGIRPCSSSARRASSRSRATPPAATATTR